MRKYLAELWTGMPLLLQGFVFAVAYYGTLNFLCNLFR